MLVHRPALLMPHTPLTLSAELLLNKTWRPQLAVVGCDGIPSLEGGAFFVLLGLPRVPSSSLNSLADMYAFQGMC